jgi:hypothetical protein
MAFVIWGGVNPYLVILMYCAIYLVKLGKFDILLHMKQKVTTPEILPCQCGRLPKVVIAPVIHRHETSRNLPLKH